MKTRILSLFLLTAFLFTACTQSSGNKGDSMPYQPEWTKSANIYEVNVRQYTEEGTFTAFAEEMPRLREMGVDILWFMPIHPIGELNRKGDLGSYYAVRDYKGINPDFGTMDDFKTVVDQAHELGMKVIIDWVPNHTAWDHPWIEEHPEYYAKDEEGNITYEADWTDIALLDYHSSKELWSDMIDALSFWITDADIDGFRVDHAAHEIPMEFWEEAIPAVDQHKDDLFWLAEWHEPKLYPTFDASYAWDYFHVTTSIGKGEEGVEALDRYMEESAEKYPANAYQMYFTSNHDENSWNGTDEQLFGDNYENFTVMAATIDGFFLVYSGQETALDKQLEFFTKDPIEWDGYENADLYSMLFSLIDDNEALWNGAYGGSFTRIDSPDETYAYSRDKGDSQVIVLLNFSDESQTILVNNTTNDTYDYTAKGGTEITIATDYALGDNGVTIAPHSWVILNK